MDTVLPPLPDDPEGAARVRQMLRDVQEECAPALARIARARRRAEDAAATLPMP